MSILVTIRLMLFLFKTQREALTEDITIWSS
jgi:hypothetical protein